MSTVDLEDVIVQSVEDSVTPEAPETSDPVVETPTEVAPEATPEAVESTTPTEVAPESTDSQVASPAAKAAVPAVPQDDFEKKFGIPKESAPGRENRIPYSRVTKIVSKAIKDAEASFTPKIQEFEAKVKDYETKLVAASDLEKRVADFEKVMVNDQDRFIAYLKQIPGYEKYFSPAQAAPAVQEAPTVDNMPLPEDELSDGSKVYSLEGLRKLNEWNRAEARKETLAEVQKIYGPIAQNYEEQQKQAAAIKYQQEVLIPQVNAQIQEAHTWPLFKENEDAIVKVLNENPKFNLERAYQVVVLPKLQSNRDDIRKQVLKDLQKAPVATSAPTSFSRPSLAPAKSGPRDIEDIIREQAANLPR